MQDRNNLTRRGEQGPTIGFGRLVLPALAITGIAAMAAVDGLVAAIMAILFAGAYGAVRWRGQHTLKRVIVLSVAGVAVSSSALALALPVYAQRPARLIINLTPESSSPNAAPLGGARPSFEIIGYVASDYEDSAAGVDTDVKRVSALAPTSANLGSAPGTIEVTDASDTLVRAHAEGTRALLVVSNFDGTDFNGARVASLLSSHEATSKFISALSKLVAKGGWDGVVLDFENLLPSTRKSFPQLISTLHDTLGGRTVDVAVPAFTDSSDPDLRSYDLHAIGAAADRVTWMAYDQHELTTKAGPVASLDWVKASIRLALTKIPAPKLDLGIASYGYAWPTHGTPVEYSAREFRAMADNGTLHPHWDATAAEWTGTLRNGSTVWYSDGRSMAAATQAALDNGLGGVALWRVGADEPGALDQLPVAAQRPRNEPMPPRSVRDVHATGVVALTFDDGPDPRWTPKILSILRAEHVPATFFTIGQQAQKHPSLLRAEVRSGDVVGNHTYSHKNLSQAGSLRTKVEILGGASVIEGITGQDPVLFRSPYGAGDTSTKKVGADQIANDLGEHAVGWNVDPLDWSRPGAAAITDRVMSTIQERSIVLLHDGGGDRSQTVAALPALIERLKAKHYLFTTVDGLDGSVPYPYRQRVTLASKARGVALVAAYRLWIASRRAALLILLTLAGLSVFRLLLASPLAAIQAIRHRRWKRRLSAANPATTPTTSLPGVTFAVPAHNEAVVIAKTIRSLEAVAIPERCPFVEIIVIDDGSTDGTADVARGAANPERTRVISQPASKKAGALNRAFAEAKGEVVIVVDADTVADPGLVSAMLPHFADDNVGAVAGNVKVGNQKTIFGKLQALEYVVSLNLDRRAQAAANVMAVVPGAAGAFRRSAVVACGGYSTDTLVEDADLTVALLSQGWKIPYEPAAIAYTEAPQTMRDVIRQRRRWSYGTVEVLRKYRSLLFRARGGRVGLLGLPWMFLSQVVTPVVGPACELFLAYLVAVHNVGEAAGIVGLAIVGDLVVSAAVVIANREPLRMLAYVPLARLIWRPLQLYAIAASTIRWLNGRPDNWRKVTRYNAVTIGNGPTSSPVSS